MAFSLWLPSIERCTYRRGIAVDSLSLGSSIYLALSTSTASNLERNTSRLHSRMRVQPDKHKKSYFTDARDIPNKQKHHPLHWTKSEMLGRTSEAPGPGDHQVKVAKLGENDGFPFKVRHEVAATVSRAWVHSPPSLIHKSCGITIRFPYK